MGNQSPDLNIAPAGSFEGGISVLDTLFNFAIYKILPYNEVVAMIESDNLYLGTEAAKRVFGSLGGVLRHGDQHPDRGPVTSIMDLVAPTIGVLISFAFNAKLKKGKAQQ